MQFLVTLVQLSFLLRVIWQNVEGLAKKLTSGTLDTIWEVTGTKLPVLPVPPGHPVSKQNADANPTQDDNNNQQGDGCAYPGPDAQPDNLPGGPNDWNLDNFVPHLVALCTSRDFIKGLSHASHIMI